jgi:hypothetical protein
VHKLEATLAARHGVAPGRRRQPGDGGLDCGSGRVVRGRRRLSLDSLSCSHWQLFRRLSWWHGRLGGFPPATPMPAPAKATHTTAVDKRKDEILLLHLQTENFHARVELTQQHAPPCRAKSQEGFTSVWLRHERHARGHVEGHGDHPQLLRGRVRDGERSAVQRNG